LNTKLITGFILVCQTLFFLFGFVKPSYSISPEEVLVVYNGDNIDSVKLAKEYQAIRKIPEKNMCYVICTSSETISRDEYNQKIRKKIENHLIKNSIKEKILFITTIYGLPLGIYENELGDLQEKNKELLGIINDKSRFINSEKSIALLKNEIAANDKKANDIKARRSHASLDSELSLLFNNYDTTGWIRNPYFFYNKSYERFSRKFPIYLVARLDGHNPDEVRRIMDDTIKAEIDGLKGTAYFDTRGIYNGTDAYCAMDKFIFQSSELTEKAGIKTVVEKTGKLFGKSECPDTAIYWGWYRLQNYMDSFTFVPGAITVHIASGECESLKRGNFWCPQFLLHGATVTIGPIDEPYVSSFPNPKIFIAALLDGYTLAEAYYLSTPYLSWQMVLVGDPIYRPFKKRINQKLR